MVHVLVGQESFVELTEQAAAKGATVRWIVPKKARPGDEVLLFFPHLGFLGHGEIVSNPESTVFGRRPTYEADVASIILFKSPILLHTVAKRFPDWAWVGYPRSFTTPRQEIAASLFPFLLGNIRDKRRLKKGSQKKRQKSS